MPRLRPATKIRTLVSPICLCVSGSLVTSVRVSKSAVMKRKTERLVVAHLDAGTNGAGRCGRRVVLAGAIAAVAFAVLALAVPAVAGPAVSFHFPPGSGCGPSNVEGWEFQTTAAVTVAALGVYDYQGDGMDFATPVGLYDSSCTLLASAMIPAGTGAVLRDGYRYVGITPLLLSSGQTFRVAAVMHCNDYTPDVSSLTDVSIDPSLTAVLSRRIAFGSSLACPTETITAFEFGPNFLIGPACGNGVVQADEECDDGNTADGDCCSPTCQYEENGSKCPADDELCTDDVCDATGTCLHPAGNAGAVCRAAAGECDLAEECDGISSACPDDGFQPNDTPCTDDGLYCSGDETCQNGTCTSSGDPCTEGTCDEPTDQCLTPSPTATATPTVSNTPTITLPPTATVTLSPTSTVTLAPTGTVTPTAINTATASATPVPSASVTPTRISSPTATLVPTGTATVTPSTILTFTPLPTPTRTPVTVACAGDCDGNGTVAISELITGVTIALGSQPLDRCPAFDSSGNSGVEINELIAAVSNALDGCL